ncbi:GT4 family glycosyltransferase PelF [Bacillus sp. Marseille-P3661]|uniref:GT4 family glycosyltransferase PelF n=1 Tax=Bacillus sp. Marseille-P3661 TaxID=1936234 RepID=UPI000C8449F8|nr:GT4 family glycosyltransferase PelF [Bacillus sp. Marseille-P3661]
MRICIIAEGSYPYTLGGVAGWVHNLIASMPEHEFVIYAICATEKMKKNYYYQLPENVVGIEEVSLDTFISEKTKWGKRYKLTHEESFSIRSILDSKLANWEKVFSLFTSGKIDSVTNFLTSKDFFDILKQICLENYVYTPFTTMYWTLRSMVLSLFICINHKAPKADLYHSVSAGYAGVVGSIATYQYNKPYILTEHGIYSREREEEIIKANWVKGQFKDIWIQYFYNMSSCAYTFASEIVTLYKRNQEVQKELGCSPDKMSIIPNGVSLEEFQDLPQAIDKGNDEIFIGAIVRVTPIKDIKTLLQSFSIVKRKRSNTKFFIMGPVDEDKDYYQECLKLMETLALEDVTFTGPVNIKKYIQSMDVLVLSSISEAQPLAILEGLACRIPFVATDVGACRELLTNANDTFGMAGIIVPVMHYLQMAEGILYLCENEEVRQRMGENGYQRVKKYYTKEKWIENYRALYQKYGD